MPLKPGPAATREDFERAQFLQQLRSTELDRVRDAAKNWRTGLAGLVALITTISVVKGKSTLGDLAPTWRVAVTSLMALALVFAAYGAYRSLRAAYGMPKLIPSRAASQERLQFAATSRSIGDLRWAIGLSYATLAALALAVGISWFAPSGGPFVRISTSSGRICGTLIGLSAGAINVQTRDGIERRIAVTTIDSLTRVDSCS